MKIFVAKCVVSIVVMMCNVSTLCAAVHVADKKSEIENLNRKLSDAVFPADSMKILADLFDLHPRVVKDSIGKMLFKAALSAGDADYGLDALRNLGNLHLKSDSLLEVDIRNTMRFGPSDDRDETVTFLRMLRNIAAVRYSSEDVREREYHRAVRQLGEYKELGKYDKIVLLHAVCLYISSGSQGGLLSKYIDMLGELIEQLRPEAYCLRNCYYVQAAVAYAANGEYGKAVDNDRKLLATIDAMEAGDTGMNRRYRDYNDSRYIVFTRLLSSFSALSDGEVEEYYTRAMNLVDTGESAAHTNAISGLPQIFYTMYKRNYPEALALLRKYMDMPYNDFRREQLLKFAIEAAEEVGDREALLEYSRRYNDVLEETIEKRTRGKYNELQMVYDLQDIKRSHEEQSQRMERRILLWTLAAAGVLLILLIIVALLLRHKKRLAADLRVTNEALMLESENLRVSKAELLKARDEARKAAQVKSVFIKNFSNEVAVPLRTINEYTNLIIDCSEAGYKPYLKHFAELVALNSEVVITIMNDVLNLSEIDSDTIVVKCSRQRLEPLLVAAVTSMRHHMQEGVALRLDALGNDVYVDVDPHRLVQIMVQLISNAAKATQDGSVVVSCEIDKIAGKVEISVTDTGFGIPAQNSERIFERFVKLDRTSAGVGVGLTVARHLARLLGGDLRLDTSYTSGGARFILTLRLSQE